MAIESFNRLMVDISGVAKPITGIPKSALGYKAVFAANKYPVIFVRFLDSVQKHMLYDDGKGGLEPYEMPDETVVFRDFDSDNSKR